MTNQLPSDAGWWTACAVAAGGGIKWLFAWRARSKDSYHGKLRDWDADLRKREAELDSKVSEHMAQCEAELRKVRVELTELAQRASRTEIGLILLAQETHAHNPASLALQQVRALLGRHFPLNFDTPADMTALLSRIGGN